jgi:hypothetical protein
MRSLASRLFCATLLTVGLLIAAVTHGQDFPAPPTGRALPTPQQMAAQAIQRKLDEKTEIDVAELELGQLMRDISQKHNLQIVLDPKGLETAGVSPDQLITLNLHGITLRSVLRHLLRPLNLTAVVQDETLVVTSLDCDENSATVRVINLGGWLGEAPQDVLAALEAVWPREENTDPSRCKPRAALVGDKLVVRGSPRHHELVEELLRNLRNTP